MLRRLRRAAAAGRVRLAPLTLLLLGSLYLRRSSLTDVTSPWGRCGWLGHQLSMTSRAEDLRRPPAAAADQSLACLRRRRTRRVVFVGHSRLRQVYERMSERLALRPVTRANPDNVPLSPAPFLDATVPAGWRSLTVDNSTCLEVWPKVHHKPPDAWCSLAAAGPQLTLEFRWRFGLRGFLLLITLLSRACLTGDCVDVLVLTQGLHFLAFGGFDTQSAIYRDTLEYMAEQLRPMTAGGTRVIWMLEHGFNKWSRHNAEPMDDLGALNAMVHETLLLQDLQRTWVWSSHLEKVSEFLLRSCLSKNFDAAGDFEVCKEEVFHVNNGTLAQMVDELLHFMCAC